MDRLISSLKSTYNFWDEHVLPITIFTVVGFLLLVFLERWIPVENGHTKKGFIRNLAFGSAKYLFGSALLGVVMVLMPWNPNVYSNDSIKEIAIYTIQFLLLQDLLFYLYHRAQHSWKWLWPVHEMHHSDNELNVSTSYRIHWLESAFQYVVIIYPILMILGVHIEGILSTAIVATALLLFSHSNLKVHLGAIGFLIVGPQYHRIHHSIQDKHQAKNLAQFFPLFDWLGGTYYHPAPREYPPTGTKSLSPDTPFWTVINKPFSRWMGRKKE